MKPTLTFPSNPRGEEEEEKEKEEKEEGRTNLGFLTDHNPAGKVPPDTKNVANLEDIVLYHVLNLDLCRFPGDGIGLQALLLAPILLKLLVLPAVEFAGHASAARLFGPPDVLGLVLALGQVVLPLRDRVLEDRRLEEGVVNLRFGVRLVDLAGGWVYDIASGEHGDDFVALLLREDLFEEFLVEYFLWLSGLGG